MSQDARQSSCRCDVQWRRQSGFEPATKGGTTRERGKKNPFLSCKLYFALFQALFLQTTFCLHASNCGGKPHPSALALFNPSSTGMRWAVFSIREMAKIQVYVTTEWKKREKETHSHTRKHFLAFQPATCSNELCKISPNIVANLAEKKRNADEKICAWK